jgi:DNA-binding PadR family transcriptional regulator
MAKSLTEYDFLDVLTNEWKSTVAIGEELREKFSQAPPIAWLFGTVDRLERVGFIETQSEEIGDNTVLLVKLTLRGLTHLHNRPDQEQPWGGSVLT